MKILLPVDGSSYTKKMLGYVASTPEIFGKDNEYTLLTVVTPLPPQAISLLGKKTVDEYYRETADKVLTPASQFLERHGLGYKCDFKVGYVSDVLPDAADEGKFQLVVMGSHGHSSIGNLVLGSVANAVIAKTTIPVLLVR